MTAEETYTSVSLEEIPVGNILTLDYKNKYSFYD